MSVPASRHGYRLGLALSGGGLRGVAHIGVLRAMARRDLKADFVAGTSAGSLIGALYASGKAVDEIEAVAHQIFWPALLRSQGVKEFCRKYLPQTFAELTLPFRVAVTALPSWKTVIVDSGELAPALAASCATPYLLHRVKIGEATYTDGGWGCVLPATVCRPCCRTVIGSDVWLRSSMAKRFGISMEGRWGERIYARHYLEAFRHCDIAIQPQIPVLALVPNRAGIDRLIKSGEAAGDESLVNSPASSPN